MALALPASAPARAAETQGSCLNNAAMQDALAGGQARRLTEIRRGLDGEIVRADLCLDDGKLVYRVTVLAPEGQVRRITVDAQSGAFMYDRRN